MGPGPPPAHTCSRVARVAGLGTTSGETRSGPREGPILALFALLVFAAVGVVLWREEHDALHDPVKKGERGELVGIEGDSLVRAENFARALREIGERMAPGDVVLSLRLSPVRVDANVRDETGQARILNVDAGFGVTSREFGESTQRGIEVRRIDPAAPQRMFTTVRRLAPARQRDLDYVVLSVPLGSDPDPPFWNMFLVDVPIARKQWFADLDGTGVRRPGEPRTGERR
jgi:hypothetical protein